MVSPPARAWHLNFHAENELANPSAHTPSLAVFQRSVTLIEKVRALLGPGDVVLPSPDAAGLHGRAWCPTPSALAALARAGARATQAPPVDVLRRVNHRRFCAELGQTLDGARYVTTRDGLRAALAGRDETWVLKRPFGFAGRDQRRISPDQLGDSDKEWIAASLATGEGLQVEPWVDRDRDFALHGYVSRDSTVTLGKPTTQHCDEHGQWVESRLAASSMLSTSERDALFTAAAETAAALVRSGYFGPFGIDAFRYRDGHGTLLFNPRCEINARYSMGWAIGMGAVRPDLEDD
jgi:hypothetical protein